MRANGKRRVGIAFLAVVATFLAVCSTRAFAADEAVSVLRLYNPYLSGAHLLTADEHEYEELQRLGWESEGEAFRCSKTDGQAVYRLYNPHNGDHFYTASSHEYATLQQVGWIGEDVAFYGAEASRGVPIYRLWNSYQTAHGGLGSHLWTADKNEYATLPTFEPQGAWKQEDIAWYGFSPVSEGLYIATENLGEYVGERDVPFYALGEAFTGSVTGTLSDPKEVSKLSYVVEDDAGIVVKSGSIEPASHWSIDELGFVVGLNKLSVTATLSNGSTLSDSVWVGSTSPELMERAVVDEGDTDRDGLNNYLEARYGTDINTSDTDGDGISDYVEVLVLDYYDPLKVDSDGDGVFDGNEDYDKDGLTNGEETSLGTDLALLDSDGDGLSDSQEVREHKTNPLSTDTDGDGASDAWELENKYDPLVPQSSFQVALESPAPTSADPVTAGVLATLSGAEAQTLELTPVNEANTLFVSAKVAGYLGDAYELSLEGTLGSAKLTFCYDPSLGSAGKEFQPRIYKVNEAAKTYEELPNQTVANHQVSASVTEPSTYILLNKAEVDALWERGQGIAPPAEANALTAPASGVASSVDTTTDTNGDGIPDYYNDLIRAGDLATSFGSLEFKGIDFNFNIDGEPSDDYDGDGIKNGDELGVYYDPELERLFLDIVTSPLLADSDGDGESDAKDAHPLAWDVSDRDLAMFAALAYETPTTYYDGTLNNNHYFFTFGNADEVRGHWDIVSWSGDLWADISTYFTAMAFKNGNNVVIAYRGTSSGWGEWANNFLGYGALNHHTEEGFAQHFAKVIAARYPECNIYVTGHSLGGYLSQIGTVALLDNFSSLNLVKVANFNGMGMKFNEKLFWTKNHEMDVLKKYYHDNNLVCFRIKGDVVSALGTHLGAISAYRAADPMIQYYKEKPGEGTFEELLQEAAGYLAIYLVKSDASQYYKEYGIPSKSNFLWVTHETKSFFYYLKR